jgi:hypothetical protein
LIGRVAEELGESFDVVGGVGKAAVAVALVRPVIDDHVERIVSI